MANPTQFNASKVQGAVQLWTQIVQALESANYTTILPEYLRLSRMLAQTHATELLLGRAEISHWERLRKLSGRSLEILMPLIEAARVLHELPTDITEVGQAAARQVQPEPTSEAAAPHEVAAPASVPDANKRSAQTATKKRPVAKSTSKAAGRKQSAAPAKKTNARRK